MSRTKVNFKLDRKLIRQVTKNCSRRGTFAALDHLASVSKDQVPLDQGILKASCVVDVNDDGSAGTVSYDTSYAVVQHENQHFHHQRGRKAKYLEDPVYDSGVQSEMVSLAGSEFSSEMG